ncbi:MAG: hypothetical protein GY786_03745 [Proteobacteria bacterium]|nr:hypothetical protein [Pseudomonadota bacterium]
MEDNNAQEARRILIRLAYKIAQETREKIALDNKAKKKQKKVHKNRISVDDFRSILEKYDKEFMGMGLDQLSLAENFAIYKANQTSEMPTIGELETIFELLATTLLDTDTAKKVAKLDEITKIRPVQMWNDQDESGAEQYKKKTIKEIWETQHNRVLAKMGIFHEEELKRHIETYLLKWYWGRRYLKALPGGYYAVEKNKIVALVVQRGNLDE